MPTAVVTSKGQITLPKGLREALGVEALLAAKQIAVEQSDTGFELLQ